MKYKPNESIFIREEIQNDESVYFVYVGDNDEMYKLNKASYDCFELVTSRSSIDEICMELCDKYNKTNIDDIHKTVNETIVKLIQIGIIKCEQE